MNLAATIDILKKSGLLHTSFSANCSDLFVLYQGVEEACPDRVMALPVDEIESLSSYMVLFRELVKITQLPITVKRVIANRDKNSDRHILLSFVAGDKLYSWRFEWQPPYVNEEFLALSRDFIAEHATGNKLINATPEDSYWLLMSLPIEALEALDNAKVQYQLF